MTTTEDRIIEKKKTVSAADLMKIDYPQIEYYINPLIPKGSVILIGGKPSSFKSFLVLNLALSLITQDYFIGRFKNNNNCKILLYDMENDEREIRRRLYYISNGLGIKDTSTLDRLEICNEFDKVKYPDEVATALKYDIIILDSYRRFLPGDENDSRWTDQFYRLFLKPLKDAGKTIIIIHHLRKSKLENISDSDLQDLLRGSSDLPAQVELLFIIIKSIQKTSDDGKNETFNLSLLVGKNRLGIPINDCVFKVIKNDEIKETRLEFKNWGYSDPDTEIHEFVIELLKNGEKQRKELIDGITKKFRRSIPTTDNILKYMVDVDMIYKPKHGYYAIKND